MKWTHKNSNLDLSKIVRLQTASARAKTVLSKVEVPKGTSKEEKRFVAEIRWFWVYKALGKSSLVSTLLLASFSSVGLYLVGALFYETGQFWYLNWNLFLAWVPLILAFWLMRSLQQHQWTSWQNISITLLWLIFLPNSFYIVSDFIHLKTDYIANALYSTVILMSFSVTGMVLGYVSLLMVHNALLKRLPTKTTHKIITIVLFLCGFAIYLGRSLHWNTWDILINPAGLLFDVSDHILNPSAHPQTFATTFSFFVLISSFYLIIWQFIKVIRNERD